MFSNLEGVDAVDPRADAVALGDDPVPVPRAVLEGGAGLAVVGEVIQPLGAATLVPEVARDSERLIGDLTLVAVDLARLADPLRVRLLGGVLLVDVAADLDPRVERWVAED